MKKVFLLLAMAVWLGGCSGGVNSSLLNMNMEVSLPFLDGEERQAVVYPSQAAAPGGNLLAQGHEAEWRSIEGDYPEYRFNP